MSDLFSTVLATASFEGVEFPVSRFEVDEAYDVVEHTSYRKDGANVETTGRRARRGSFDIPMFNDIEEGELFPARYDDLYRAVSANRIGTLSHPTKGQFQAALTNIHEAGEADARDGVHLTITWVEHNDSAGLIFADLGSLGDAPATTQARATTADQEMAAAAPTGGYTPTRPVIDAQLAVIEGEAASFAATTAALRTMAAVVEANAELEIFAGVDAHAAVAALADLRAAVVALRSRYLPEQSRVREIVLEAPLADWQVALSEYGDATRATLIRQANALPDYLAIPAGTRLTILPAD
jgi:hypothetical protein